MSVTKRLNVTNIFQSPMSSTSKYQNFKQISYIDVDDKCYFCQQHRLPFKFSVLLSPQHYFVTNITLVSLMQYSLTRPKKNSDILDRVFRGHKRSIVLWCETRFYLSLVSFFSKMMDHRDNILQSLHFILDY